MGSVMRIEKAMVEASSLGWRCKELVVLYSDPCGTFCHQLTTRLLKRDTCLGQTTLKARGKTYTLAGLPLQSQLRTSGYRLN